MNLTTAAPRFDWLKADKEDPATMQLIRAHDPALSVPFDPALGRWIVVRVNAQGGMYPQFVYEDGEGNYLPLDHRLYELLLKSDRWKHMKNAAEGARMGKDAQKDREKQAQAGFADDMKHLTKDHRVTFNRFNEKNKIRDLTG